MMVYQIEVSAVGRCGYFGYFAIDGCFLLAVDIFASSDGYVFVAYAGGGLDVFLQVEGELLVVVRWAS